MAHELFEIAGKKAIVTGGGKGLGRGMAEALLEAGCKTVIIGSTESAESACAGFKVRGFDCQSVRGDFRSRDEAAGSFEKALSLLGGDLDIFVSVSGINRRHMPEDFPLSDWDDVMNVNLNSVFVQCQLAGRAMLPKGYGKIIIVSSLTYYQGGHTIPAYAASKGGVAQLAKALGNDWAGKGINVNSVAPGYMATDMNSALLGNETRLKQINERIPAGRWGTEKDVKGITIFLASRASDYMSGAIIPVDGGYLTR